VNQTDCQAKTALHYAASLGRYKIIPLLLQSGADITIKDKQGNTAMQLSANDQTREMIILYSAKQSEKHYESG